VKALLLNPLSENAGMFSSVNNFIKLCRKPKVSEYLVSISGLYVPYLLAKAKEKGLG